MARTPAPKPNAGNTDDTVRLPRTRPKRVPWRWAVAAGAAMLVLAISLALLTAARPHALKLADEAELLGQPTERTTLFRLRSAPVIVVVLFSSSHAQALALNRVGAFVEKAGVPHDRVLDDASLDRAIAASGDRFDDYYQGHDYRAADLRRFFEDAGRDHVRLRPAETWLRAQLSAAGVLSPGAADAVIAIPPASPSLGIDAAGRRVILRHEVSHGVFFTDPAYSAYVMRFWRTVLTPQDRAIFRTYLQGQGYDPSNGELMANECQAYLVFTDDARYFSAAMLGMREGRLSGLRRAFVGGMPEGWLKQGVLF